MKLIAKIIVVIAVFFAGFFVGQYEALSPSDGNVGTNQAINQQLTVSLMLDFGNGTIKSFTDVVLPQDATVFDMLKKVTAENNLNLQYKDYGGDLGVLVQSIGDQAGDVKTNTFWEYWVNDKHADIGASGYKLKTGDVVEWKYLKNTFEQ
ncbi:MAG: DUF4430 domain-containing protein [Patescibacteria group bacterium]|nr:DUF4430 domain-containing protein [Patescibacteria group bacterium]